MNDTKKDVVNKIDAIENTFANKLQSEEARERIIHVVCDSNKVNEKINSLCDKKIKDFENRQEIKTFEKIKKWIRLWIPLVVSTIIGVAGIFAIITKPNEQTIIIPAADRTSNIPTANK